MPRDNSCDQCGGMFDDDDMDGSTCIFCAAGAESGQEREDDDESS